MPGPSAQNRSCATLAAALSWRPVDSAWASLIGFVTLLLFPFLGILGLLKSRAGPLLLWAWLAWLAIGALALARGWHAGMTRGQFLHGWLVGLCLGGGFIAIDRLRRKRRISRWLKLGVAAMTVLVFAKALHDFLQRHG